LDSMKELDCKCCCSCGVTAKYRNHYCSVTMKCKMARCYHALQGEVEGFGTSATCCGSYTKRVDVSVVGQHAGILREHDGLGKQPEASLTNAYCCGCGSTTHGSNHYSIHNGRKVMESCHHPPQVLGQENDNRALCKGCFEK
jgi:hypothetical protein